MVSQSLRIQDARFLPRLHLWISGAGSPSAQDLRPGFILNVPSRAPQQMRGRFQTYPLIEAQQKPSVDVPRPASACSTRQID